MNIYVDSIVANPYRKIDKYPIDRQKVDALKASIEQTGFWDNLVVREHPDNPGSYQLAYGHHRIQAVRELGIERVDLPVRDIDNATMLRMMAQENSDTYRPHPKVIHETILAAKEFIDGELARYETWEAFEGASAKNSIGSLVDGEGAFHNLRARGAGRNIITTFLGGNFKKWMVEAALQNLSDPQINRDALEKFDSMSAADSFKREVKKYNLDHDEQEEVAEAISETEISKREVADATKRFLQEKTNIRLEQESLPVDRELVKLQSNIKQATSLTKDLVTSLWGVIRKARELNATSINSIESMELHIEMKELIHAIDEVKKHMGSQEE